MAGNVWEWCLTAYSDNLQALHEGSRSTSAPSGLSDQEWRMVDDVRRLSDKPDRRLEPVCAAARVLRGGSWVSDPGDLRCAGRDGDLPSYQFSYVGFRVCCVWGAPSLLCVTPLGA
jgi:formylglycine-generating enzyme required for sulfatase activity